MCYIETSNLDGETNLKIRSALQQTCDLDSGIKLAEVNGLIECELPNREIYDFKVRISAKLSRAKLLVSPDVHRCAPGLGWLGF